MQSPGFAPTGAQCAIHTDRAAQHTCARCGNFMCTECSQGGSNAQCPTCLNLAGGAFPFSRTDFDFNRVWDYAFDLWKREWVMLSAGALIFFGVSMVGSVFSSIGQQAVGAAGKGDVKTILIGTMVGSFCGQIVNTVLQGAVMLGFFRMIFDVLQGQKADVARMFSQLAKLPRYIVQVLLVFLMFGLPVLLYIGLVFGLAVGVSGASLSGGMEQLGQQMFESPAPLLIISAGMLVLIPVLIYVSLPLQLASMELVYGDCDALESIKRAWKLADGFRLQIFGYGFVGGLVMLVGFLACCIGILPAFGLYQLLMLTLFLALRTGSDLPAPPPA